MEVQYPLVFFTLLLCLASGMFAFQGWLIAVGKGTKKFHTVTLGVILAAVVLGGFSSFLHLHHWERIFNGFGHITSGITQELIGIVVLVVAMLIVFVVLRKSTAAGESVPKWTGIMALVVGVAMGFVCAHSYYMASIPAWSNLTLYLYYYSSELILGATGIWAVAAVCKEDASMVGKLAAIGLVAGIVSALVIVVCGFFYTTISFHDVGIAFHTTDPTAPAANPEGTLASPFFGADAPLFWGGAVVLGSLVPAVCAFFGKGKLESAMPLSLLAVVCALAGGVAFRVVLYVVGVTSYVYF